MNPVTSLELKRPVLHLKCLDNGLVAAVDDETEIHFYHQHTLERVAVMHVGISHETLSSTRVDVGSKGQVCVSVNDAARNATLYSVKHKRHLLNVGRHQGVVESVVIDPMLRYFVTGGQDGKVFVWSINDQALCDTLPPHTDFIAALATSNDGELIASAGYDRRIHVGFFDNEKKPFVLKGHKAPVKHLAFVDNNRLISSDKSGQIILWDVLHGALIRRFQQLPDVITSLCLITTHPMLLVGTNLGYVALFDIDSGACLIDRYVVVKGAVTAMSVDAESLYVGTAMGQLQSFQLLDDASVYEKLLRRKQYKRFYRLAEENPLLQYTAWYSEAELAWDDAIEDARLHCMNGDVLQAKRILMPFENIRGKNDAVQQLTEQSEAYRTFEEHVDARRYSVAYALLAQYPDFRQSDAFNQMEAVWSRCFKQAHELLESKRREDEAREVLAPFRGISEKTALIQQLFSQWKRLHLFRDHIKKRQWKQAFELVKNFPFLCEYDEYKKAVAYGDNLYIAALKAKEEEKKEQAAQLLRTLSDFPDFKSDAEALLNELYQP
jgi:hypothetical protein